MSPVLKIFLNPLPGAPSKAKYTSPTIQHPHGKFMAVTNSLRQKRNMHR